MASQIYNEAKAAMMNGSIDLDNDDLRVAIVMANTTADTDNDAVQFVDDIGTLDEMDGSGYSRQALASEAVTVDDTNDRGELDAADVDFGALGAGTRNGVGLVLYKHVTNDADSPAIAFIEFPSAVTFDGTNFSVEWNAEGIIHLT